MKTVRRLIYRDLVSTIAFVCLGFIALFSFFDLVDELSSVGVQNYQLIHALGYVLLQIPGHLYELLPIGVLIGGVLVMARFAASSEFTILRTSGLDPQRTLKILLLLGAGFVMLTFVIGDYLSPFANREAQLLKAKYQGTASLGQAGAWLKEQQPYSHYAVNVNALDGDGNMTGIRVYEFDTAGRVVSSTTAAQGQFMDGAWLLKTAKRVEFPAAKPAKNWQAPLTIINLPEYRWPTEINAQMVSVALLKPERMSAYNLFRYIQHLNSNSQSAQLYEIEFWKKLFYPLSCMVMLMLALPFAYLHFRSGGIAGYVFGGVVTGISFFLLNNVFGYIGNISHWEPWLAAAAPSLIYFCVSLGAFSWVVYKK
ncbi:MAG: LPS export ABC transporter permease LptG [Cytophagales bacterium]|nr:LPS export ABC transporter permease LptG [Cytophagales bacterium]